MAKKIAMENWRVEKNYLAQDYEDSMLSTSSPFQTYAEARKAYWDAVKDYCVDNKRRHCRCVLVHYTWKDKNSYAEHEVIRTNYKEGWNFR